MLALITKRWGWIALTVILAAFLISQFQRPDLETRRR